MYAIRTRRAAAALVLVPALALTGACGGGDEEAAERIAENALEDANGGDADVDIDGDEVTIETDEGTMSMGQDLPSDFPSDVTLLEGEILTAMSLTGTGWTVLMTIDGNPADVAEEAKAALGDAYTVDGEFKAQDVVNYSLKGPEYTITVSTTLGTDGEGTALSYNVAPNQE